MKNLLKKLSRFERFDRRAELEQEAAERIKSVGSQAPAEASAASAWDVAAPTPPEAPAHDVPPAGDTPSAGRRLTVQERVAARQLQAQGR